MEDPDTQTTLSIPSLVAFAVLSFLAIRYFFFSSSSSSSNRQTYPANQSASRSRRNFPPERVETVATMFPQLTRRDIEWDLVMNGGSVQATTEKVLRDGRLPVAPPNFTAQYANTGSAAPSESRNQPQKQTYTDLITRYNLGSRLANLTASPPATSSTEQIYGDDDDGSVIQSSEKQKEKGGWSSNKDERQALLRRRREEMVLAARKKMEEKDRKGKERAM